MSQQDDEFEEWFAQQVWPAGNGAGWAMCRAAWQAARRAPEHEKAAPTARPLGLSREQMVGLVTGNPLVQAVMLATGCSELDAKAALFRLREIGALSPPPVSAEQRERLARYRRHLADWCLEARPNSDTAAIVAIARDLAALCEEVMGKQTG